MKKSFVLIGIILIIGTICAGMEVQASTSSELYESTDAYYNYQKYANNYETPYSANLENNVTIDEMTGSLRLQETDISLPGKNGLDVNITRIYNNSDTGYKLNSKNDNKTSTYLGYLYESEAGYMYVYFDEEKYIDGAPVSFMAPRDISGHVWSANNVDKYGKSSAVSYDMIKRIQPKSNEKVVEYTKCSDNAVIFNGVNMGSFQDMGEFKLGDSFKLAWPRIVFDSTGHSGEFENENGEVFSFSLGDKTYDPEINEYDGRCFGKTGSDTTILRHKIEKFFKKERVYKGVTYTERVKDIDGKTYYFYQEDNSKISKIRLIEDIYGNTILYTYDEIGNVTITDTYDRKIKISRINLDTIIGNDYGESYTNMETRVSIENGDAKQEVVYKTYVESNNNNKIYDDKYIFEVKKKEAYDKSSADNSDCVTRYEMTRKQISVHECLYGSDDGRIFESIVSKHIPVLRLRGKDTYNIDKIVYPTGAYSLYEYSDDVKLNETEYVDYFIKASKVLSSKEILKYGICKNEYNYSYKSQADFTKYDLYNITTNTTEIKDALGTVKTVNYKGDNGTYRTVFEIQSKDSSGQIINDEKYTLQSSGVTFSRKIGNYSKGNTECKTKKVETNYFRDWGNMLLSESVGNRKTNYEYALVKPDGDVSYDYMGSIIGLRSVVNRIPELTTYKKDSDTTIKIENVFGTMDGTEVAKTVKYNPTLGDEFKEEYYEEQNLFFVRSSTYENDIEKSQKKYKYDSYGNIIKERTKANETGEEIVQTNAYDYSPNGELTITSTVKDVNQPDGSVNDIITIQKFDFLGNLVYVKDGNGGEWKYEYDMLGRVTKKINPLNKFESYIYDTVNNEVIVGFEFNDGDTETKYYKYDQLGNLSSVAYEDEDDSFTELARFEYDELNRLTKEIEFVDEQTQNTAVYSYDAKNRIISSVISGSNENGKEYQKYSYEYTDYDPSAEDEGVRIVAKIPEDSNYAAVKSYYDIESGNLLRETALSRKNNSVLYGAKYEYDYVDNAIKVQSGKDYGTNKYTALTTYDYANQVLTQTNSEGKTLQSKYDMAGRMVSNTNYLGNTTEYEYDALGQVIEQKVPFEDSVQVSTRNYYDGNGNMVKVETETGEPGAIEKKYNIIENIYNPDNTLQKAVQYNGNEVLETSYEYYNNGQVKQMKIGSDDPEITSYEYDPMNNVKRITDSMGLVTNIVPDRTGNVKQVTDKNGTKTTYEYTALGSLKQSKAEKDGKQEELSYTYDSGGNVVSMTDQTGTTEYKYDEMGRLSEETKGSIEKSYTYTTDGLVKTFKLTNNGKTEQNAEYSYDSLNRLENVLDKINTAMSSSYTYYDDGNIKSESKGGKVTAAYTYNKAGLLTDMTDGGYIYI